MHLLLDLGAVMAATGLVLAAAAYLAYRWARRRWRLVRDHAAARGAMAAWAGVRAVRVARARRTPVDGWAPARARRELWRAVSAADHALAHARSVDAPVGDLPSLARRLHAGAGDLDGLLAHGSPAPSLSPPVAAQLSHLLAAADDIRLAAVDAAGEMSAPALAALATDARTELQALAAGLAAGRAAAGGTSAPVRSV